MNGVLWTLPLEFGMYLITPLICIIKNKEIRKYGIILLVFFSGIISILFQLKLIQGTYIIYGISLDWLINLTPYYVIGAAFAIFDFDKNKLNCTLALFLVFFFQIIPPDYIVVKNMIRFTILPYSIFCIAYGKKMRLSNFFDKYEISYGVYLYGFLVQQTVIYVLNKLNIRLSLISMFLVCYIITVLVALINRKLIEEPCRKLLNRILIFYYMTISSLQNR